MGHFECWRWNEKESGVEHKHRLFKNNLLVWMYVFVCAVVHVQTSKNNFAVSFLLVPLCGFQDWNSQMKGSTANVFPMSLAARRNSALWPGMECDQLSQTPVPGRRGFPAMMNSNQKLWAKQICSPARCHLNSVYHWGRERHLNRDQLKKQMIERNIN